ncbi:MAG: MotA/TolQ/ExbB proton channel family protein [Kiritimatiellae bacterium]|nr:MotA/TolQ/ExbB proton channel family protein [Kiritimatiellia bacterium]MBR1836350.1 MotA/TolQ/ExbB proton channel family protein [Kiritimatiellia bacterium]
MLETVLKAFSNSDGVGKTIVLALVAMSVFTLSKMLWKCGVLKESKRHDASFKRRDAKTSHPAQLYLRATNGFVRNIPVAEIYQAAVKELLHHLHGRGIADGDLLAWPADRTGPALPESEMASVRAAAEGALAKQQLELERGMTTLATCVNCAPSLGLFGTVWGIMCAFMAMVGGGGSINLSTVAPGIASALLTTVAGLCVSIPCSIGYNFLSDLAKSRTVEIEAFTDELLARILRYHGGSSSQGAAFAAQAPAPAPVVIQTHYPAPAPDPAVVIGGAYPAPAAPAYATVPPPPPARI